MGEGLVDLPILVPLCLSIMFSVTLRGDMEFVNMSREMLFKIFLYTSECVEVGKG